MVSIIQQGKVIIFDIILKSGVEYFDSLADSKDCRYIHRLLVRFLGGGVINLKNKENWFY